VSVAIILAAVVILGGIVVVAMGWGGELVRSPAREVSYPDFASAEDVASYRPPPALLGYQAEATERALEMIAQTIDDRDAEIAWLRARLRELAPEGRRPDGRLHPTSATGQLAAADALAAETADRPEWLQPADRAAQPSQAGLRPGDDE
jgi:hypothetical protein